MKVKTMTPEEYKNLYLKNDPIDFDFDGICGRISNGKETNQYLTNWSGDRVCFAMGPDGLKSMIGKSHYQMLIDIGFTLPYIKEQKDNVFQLVIFPQDEFTCVADWDGVARVVSLMYPEVESKVIPYIPFFKEKTFEEVQALSPINFSEINSLGYTHPNFMTTDRMIESEMSMSNARAWLYHTLGCLDLYKGDGYSYSHSGERKGIEYFARNRLRTDINGLEVIDLKIVLPQ